MSNQKNYPYATDDRRLIPPKDRDISREHQDLQKTGRDEQSGHKPPTGTLKAQIYDTTVDGVQYACDEGGLSTKFGRGAPGDKRGTSGSDYPDGEELDYMVYPAGKKMPDMESMPGR